LQAHQHQTAAALKTWQPLSQNSESQQTAILAKTLTGLWSLPPELQPDAEVQVQKGLEGWFRYQALTQLYQLQQRPDALASLLATEQQAAQQAFSKLVVIALLPGCGLLIGAGLLIFVVVQRFLKGQDAWIAQNAKQAWTTPWDGETTLQVMILTFFLMGQIVVPLSFQLLGIKANPQDQRSLGLIILANYVLFGASGAVVLYASLREFWPLPAGWFRIRWHDNWFWWGLGGYLVALPLVIVVSLVNQWLWKGQGGSNPLLPIALNDQDGVALACFYLTAAIAAPLFEEVMFRGFLLPSLTRYLPVSGAVICSSLVFAIAHLSLSEILPLTVLGIVLGVVYSRSRNLLAPMLLHGLWNSGTLLTLFILGSGAKLGG
jgi:uncharacterized protein